MGGRHAARLWRLIRRPWLKRHPQDYLGGIFGGITLDQWREVVRIPGVDVAAPIANIGYILPIGTEALTISINQFVNEDPVQLYRLRLSWPANGGISSYQRTTLYVYYTRTGRIVTHTAAGDILPELWEVTSAGERAAVCSQFWEGRPRARGPFELSRPDGESSYLTCFSALSPQVRGQNLFLDPLPEGVVGTKAEAHLPVLLAAIDPDQEARLVGLDGAVTAGRYLGVGERWRRYQEDLPGFLTQVPVLATSRTYVDQSLDVTVERLAIPRGADVPKLLASSRSFDFVTSLSGRAVGTIRRPAQELWAAELKDAQRSEPGLFVNGYWSPSPVRYRVEGPDRLRAANR